VLPIDRIRSLLLKGKPVLIFDSSSRENEVDMVFYAPKIDSRSITTLRKTAGGLICYSMPRNVGEAVGLKYMDELLRELGYGDLTTKVLGYGDPPNFSLWVNHKDVVTGIRDADRAKTIRELDKVVELVLDGKVEDAKSKFYSEFISPGHVPILLGRGLDVRRGHTEL
jgi:3,4-dihydroxy 2-butanone 4-phosphate synthase